MQTKIDKIENKIRDLVGGTRDLVFGCKLKQIVNEKDYYLKYVGKNNGQMCLLILDREELMFVPKLGESCEIIGRDLTLSDLLLAIWKMERDLILFEIRASGEVFSQNYIGGNLKHITNYNLSLSLQDNLKENKELVGFLVKILEIE